MHKDQTITLRLPRELLERASGVVPYLESEVLTSARVSRSTAIRHALERGLAELEEDAAIKAQIRESITSDLANGESPEDVATRYRRHGIRLSEVLKIAADVEKPKPRRRKSK